MLDFFINYFEEIFLGACLIFYNIPGIVKYVIEPYKEDWHKDFFNYM